MSILRNLIPLAFSILNASPALALSCMPYSPQQAFQDASASPDAYVIVHGRLEFNPADLPVVDMERQMDTLPDNYLNASLTGFSLTGAGFNARFVRQIKVNVQCYGPWCASLTPGHDYLTFLKKDGHRYLLETNPCSGFAFADPSDELLHDIYRCLLGEECEPPQY
ncbi:MAG: hypothetical protein GY945_17360 [Rhodobacteraceae bacterium]|nr:hypothetical protein [Paracoccaceae bacterium]